MPKSFQKKFGWFLGNFIKIKILKKIFNKEEDEYCPGCDNHYYIEAKENSN